MVATLVALRERAGNPRAAEAVLDTAVEWWDNHMGEDPAVVEQLIQEAAAFKLKHNKLEDAARLFERLTKSSSSVVRAEALNGLVSSTAYANPAKAESYEQKLPQFRNIDIEALERAAPVLPSMKRGRGQEDGQSKGDENTDKAVRPKKKRKRKPLYPKNFVPAKPGPPPKKKRGAGEKVRGAQGSSAASSAVTHTTASRSTPIVPLSASFPRSRLSPSLFSASSVANVR